MRMLLYVVSTAGDFFWNEGSGVQLPVPYTTLGEFLLLFDQVSIHLSIRC
jgi:hypothetical protein